MNKLIVSLVLAGVAVTAVAADASAQTRRRAYQVAANDINSLPLTVNRRSWLDPGNSSPRGGGTGPNYVSASTILARTPDRNYTDSLGNSIFPGQPYVPGRSVPVVSFSTLPNGAVVTDNVLHYQPN